MSWATVAGIITRPGVRITYLGNDRLDIRGVTADELRLMAGRKSHLLAMLILADVVDPERREHLRYVYEERAAVHEYDGGSSRTEAERLALQELRAELRMRRRPPAAGSGSSWSRCRNARRPDGGAGGDQ